MHTSLSTNNNRSETRDLDSVGVWNDGNSKYHETKVIRLDALTHVNYNSFSHSRSDIQPRQSEQRQNLQIKNLLDEDICAFSSA